MPSLTPREQLAIFEREHRNALAREAQRRAWEAQAAILHDKTEAERRAAQNEIRRMSKTSWKRGPVEALLSFSGQSFRLKVVVYGEVQLDLDLVRFDQKLIFGHIRNVIGNFGREQREGGALVGLKMLYINGKSLRSPSRHTPWMGNTLTAEHPPTDMDRCGIYALWPARKDPLRVYGDLWNYTAHPESVLTRVLGTGRCVVGTKGWRAEHCMVTDIWCHNSKTHLLSHFREKGVGIHDWDKKHGHR